jgi:hypothetical protein
MAVDSVFQQRRPRRADPERGLQKLATPAAEADTRVSLRATARWRAAESDPRGSGAWLRVSAVARTLQRECPGLMLGRVAVLAAVLGAGASCFIPPPIDPPQADGGSSHWPLIDWDYTLPKPNEDQTRNQSVPGKTEFIDFRVWVVSSSKKLSVAVFMDGILDLYKKTIFSTEATETGGGKWVFQHKLDRPCDEIANFVLGRHDLEIYFSDSGFKTQGPELDFRRLPSGDGKAISLLYRLNCQLPPGAGPDAGY